MTPGDMEALVGQLEELLAKATEPYPAPVPEQDSRVGETMAARQDHENRQRWRDRVRTATAEIVDALPLLLAERSAQAQLIEMMREAGQRVLDRMSSTYRARNGREMGIQGDDGEKCWIVHSDDITSLEAAVTAARNADGKDQP